MRNSVLSCETRTAVGVQAGVVAHNSRLAELDSTFDPDVGMIRVNLRSPGYHTTLPDGAVVHDTRQTLDYALHLLATGDPDRTRRAGDAIRRVIALQERDAYQATYGIWPWFLEEPLARMSPPDWNWADFCGARLLLAMAGFAGRLDAETVARMREAIGHAAWSIFRRNVQPGYSNIAVMGGWVTAAAGELLNEPRLLTYGRLRLQRFVAYTEHQGSFSEYNSPTYTTVILVETERCLQVVKDTATRAAAEAVRRTAWQTIAEHFHPATQQWAGPHARTYQDRLSPATAQLLTARLGQHIRASADADAALDTIDAGTIALPCPAELRERFLRLPAQEVYTHTRFEDRGGPDRDVMGTTWLSDRACLGTVNHDILWTQRRPLIAYWQTDTDPAVTLRLRFLKDGRDFASAMLTCRQDRQRADGEVTFIPDGGDFHPRLDRPSDGVFRCSDLRLRFELTGKGARVTPMSSQCWRLGAHGTLGAQVDFARAPSSTDATLADGDPVFEGGPVTFRTGSGTKGAEDQAWVDAICYQGPERILNLRTPAGPTHLPFQLCLLIQQPPDTTRRAL